jgi:DNA gyrase subunit A
MAVLNGTEASADERAAYLRRAVAERRASGTEDVEDVALVGEESAADAALNDERYEQLKAAEQFILTVSENGYGKRSSSHEFRVTGRGGKGIRATDTAKVDEIGKLVATFPINASDQLMLVTSGGQLIRVPVDGIRIAGRATKGVTIFRTADGDKVVSVDWVSEQDGDDGVGEDGTEGAAG